jgi:hypothetical protein
MRVHAVQGIMIPLLPPLTAAALAMAAAIGAADAAMPLSQEPADLRAGQKVRVDDGTCPAGQVKEVMGSAVRLPNGSVAVKRIRSCVRR